MRSLAVLELINIALIGWFVFFALDAPRTLANLAAAEYINYFHWQLMYDNRADLRRLFRTGRAARAHLGRDLKR